MVSKDATGSDELRRRFREALERKSAGGDKAESPGAGEPPEKAHGASGPAKSKRTFRRKSG
ncbi:hypothetical protein BH24ACT13_BH24ACT13_15420 [soil metagenome]|jgi:hypothetical protein